MSDSTPATLIDLLSDVVAADPDAVMVIDAQAGPLRTTRGEFWRRTVALRDDLRRHGVGRGDCLGVWLPNWSDSLVWQYAAAALGTRVIGINTRYGVAEAVHVLEKARPKVVAVAHEFLGLDLGGRLKTALGQADCPAPSVAVVAGPGAAAGAEDALSGYDVGAGAWVPSPATAELDLDALGPAPDELAVAFTTSGSTGRPKLAAHRSSAVARHAANVAAAGGWDETSVSLIILPLSGVFGFVPALAAIAGGGVILLEPRFDPAVVLRHMGEFGVTHLAGGDDISGRLMAAWRDHPTRLDTWHRLLLADFYGNSMRVCEWAESEIHTPTFGVYGSSEVFALAAFWRAQDATPDRWRAGGRPVSADIEVRTVDPVTGQPTTDSEPGELQFRGYLVVDAYLGDTDGAIRRGSFTDDGWFRSGDLGTIHPDGSFTYLCRMGDSLRLKGFLVEPAEIENRLAEHPAVARAKVVGRTVDGETRAVAFVEPMPGSDVDPAELRAWCAATLATFKVPETVHLIPEMPTTRGPNGVKIRTAALRELAEKLAAERQEAGRT